jgi:hypothetical protein
MQLNKPPTKEVDPFPHPFCLGCSKRLMAEADSDR